MAFAIGTRGSEGDLHRLMSIRPPLHGDHVIDLGRTQVRGLTAQDPKLGGRPGRIGNDPDAVVTIRCERCRGQGSAMHTDVMKSQSTIHACVEGYSPLVSALPCLFHSPLARSWR